MIIIGKDRNDLGDQLERLTSRLLHNCGYTNIQIGTIGEGGNEVDVQAEILSAVPSATTTRWLIAECKAWSVPISLPDWLKFLGKVFAKQVEVGKEVDGLFVALAGVNGAVRGSYGMLRHKNANITLLEGESLTKQVMNMYSLPSIEILISQLSDYTDRAYSSTELLYYNEKAYWAFRFQDGAVAVLDAQGILADTDLLMQVKAVLLDRLGVQSLVDLPAERKAREQRDFAAQALLTALMAADGELAFPAIEEAESTYSHSELCAALTLCKENSWVNVRPAEALILARGDIHKTIEMLKFLLAKNIHAPHWLRLVNSQFFDEMLRTELISTICEIQAGLQFQPDEESKLRQLLRLSPTALAYAIRPDVMIVTHRTQQPETAQRCNSDDVRLFFRSLFRCLRRDFLQPSLAAYFFTTARVRELELVEEYRLKGPASVILSHTVNERRSIARAVETLGGGLVHIELLLNAPEPWDWPGNMASDEAIPGEPSTKVTFDM